MSSPVLSCEFDGFWILVAGQRAPRIVVDEIRGAADDLRVLATAAGDVGPQVEELRNRLEKDTLPADVAEQFSRVSRMFSDSLPDFTAGPAQLADDLVQLALDVEKTNYSIIIEVAAFGASTVLALTLLERGVCEVRLS